MTAETEFRALLADDPAVGGLAKGIAQNAVPQESGMPFVAFASVHAPETALDGTVLVDEVTFTVQCWATTAVAADQLADAVAALITGIHAVTARASAYDEQLDLDCTVLTIQWWVT